AGRCDAAPVTMAEVDAGASLETDGSSPADAAPALSHTSRCLRVGEIDWLAARPAPVASEPRPSEEVSLRVRGLTKRYGLVSANDAIDFDARRAETLAIVGESGCGKSTLARIVMGLAQADAGTIELTDAGSEGNLARRPVSSRGGRTIRALQMIFQ